MKVLAVAEYKYNPDGDNRRLTGAGTCINAIVSAEEQIMDISFFCLSDVMSELHGKKAILSAVWKNYGKVRTFYKKEYQNLRRVYPMRDLILNIVFLGAFADALKEKKPELVHFHGFGALQHLLCRYCENQGISYLVTVHLYQHTQNVWEKSLFTGSPYKWISVVSSGMKSRMQKDYPGFEKDRIRVIVNGTDFQRKKPVLDVRQKYDIKEDVKLLLCVGSICERKNQMQLLRVYKKLSEEVREHLCMIFCGLDFTEGKFEQQIAQDNLQKRMIFIGGIRQEEMNDYYAAADGVISASKAEGFSMVFLEAMEYGLPLVLPFGLDSNDDMKSEGVSSIARDTSDEAMADAVNKWYHAKWNKEEIADYRKNFCMERVAENYENYYKDMMQYKTSGEYVWQEK